MPESKRNFWVELKRRSVYQVATVYIVAAWIIIQVADAVFPALNIPDWFLSLLIKLTILGFPITLIFSWIFEVTTKGIVITRFDNDIERDRETKRIYIISITIFIFLVIFSLGFSYFAFFRSPSGPETNISQAAIPPSITAAAYPSNSLAVLPFQNNSKDRDDYFSDGMMVEILHKLFAIDGIQLKSRTSTLKYKNITDKSVKQIAQELGVANILEGSISTLPSEDKVRINISLVDGKTENYIWKYDELNELSDIFTVQSEIATRVADHLKITLTRDVKKRIESPSTIDPAPWKLYMRAQWTANNQDDYEQAEKLVDEAIALDPNFADAYAFKGYLWLARGAWLGLAESKDALANAYPLLNKAKNLNSSYPMTHVYLALMHLWFAWDFEASETEWNTFFELSPSTPPDPGYVDFLNASGRFEEAADYSYRILNADSNIPDSWGTTGLAFYFNGNADEAVQHYEDALKRFPNVPSIVIDAARTFVYTGQYERVLDILIAENEKPENASPRALGMLSIAHHHLGNESESDAILGALIDRAKETASGSPAFYTAMVYAQKNAKEQAFQYLQQAYDKQEVEMLWMKVEPPFEPLRNDLRWFGLLQKVGFR